MTEKIKNSNPVVKLKAQTKQFGFENLRANKDNATANSGKQTYLDLNRMHIIINGKEINKNFFIEFTKGAMEANNKTDEKKSSWDNPYEQTFLAEEDKEQFKMFFNEGKKHSHLLPKTEDKNYRPFVKEFFKEIFKYADAEVPHDSILEELITNCNQAGYEGGVSMKLSEALLEHSFNLDTNSKMININCMDSSHVKIRSNMEFYVRDINKPDKEICSLTSSVKFTLESNEQESDKNVTYKDGKLLLTVPNKLKNYMIGEKNLFDVIKGYFEVFCRKLGFNFEIKIEHNFTEPSANGHLERIAQPVQSIDSKEKNSPNTTWYS